ncbi:hypothetical protein D3C80_1718670 [compost metagenome]
MPRASDQCSRVGWSGSRLPVAKLPSRKLIDTTISSGNTIRPINPSSPAWVSHRRYFTDLGCTMAISSLLRL